MIKNKPLNNNEVSKADMKKLIKSVFDNMMTSWEIRDSYVHLYNKKDISEKDKHEYFKIIMDLNNTLKEMHKMLSEILQLD
jgi:hypothetical protein